MKNWISVVAGACLVWAAFAISDPAAHGLCLEPGQGAKNFKLSDLEGKTVELSDYEGKVVLMVFWASWCSGCEEELTFLKDMSEEFTDDLVVLAINQETENPSDASMVELRRKLADADIGFPVLLDPDLRLWSDYCVNALPTSILVSRTGQVELTETHFSWASEETFRSALEKHRVIR
jgi:peroxiredoxin